MTRLLSLLIIVAAPSVRAGDRSPAPSPYHQRPSREPAPLVAEVQADDFSCGYHALASIYTSHGLDPELARLRDRLGTSVPAIPFLSDTTGTLQPDLFRVLLQDGFHARAIDLREPKMRRWLIDHLERGFYALALVKTDRPGGMHWIVFTSYHDGSLTIADSLKPEPHDLPLDSLVGGPLLSTLLITPSEPQPGSVYYMAHATGVLGMLAIFWDRSPVGFLAVFVVAASLALCAVRDLIRHLWRRCRRRISTVLPGG